MPFHGDYIPAGMAVIDGELRKAPPDPYVIIEQQKARIADLERQVKMGETLDLQLAVKDLKVQVAEMEKTIASLTKQLEGEKAHALQVEQERDQAREAAENLRFAVGKRDALPDPTPEMLAAADKARAADQEKAEQGKPKQGRKA